MPPLTLAYRPVPSSRQAAGGGGGLMSGRSILPPHYFRLTFKISTRLGVECYMRHAVAPPHTHGGNRRASFRFRLYSIIQYDYEETNLNLNGLIYLHDSKCW